MKEKFAEVRKSKKEIRDFRYKKNMEIIEKSGIPFEERATSVLIREHLWLKVDFYPGTGRWKYSQLGVQKTQAGGAEKFLKWYRQFVNKVQC